LKDEKELLKDEKELLKMEEADIGNLFEKEKPLISSRIFVMKPSVGCFGLLPDY